MGRASARAGVAAFLQPPAVTGLDAVFPSMPTIIPGSTFFGQPGKTSGAAAYVFVEQEHERRQAVSFGSWKMVTYTILIVIEFFFVGPGNTGGGAEDMGVLAMQAYDTLIDSLKTRIRSDLTCGGAFFSWANGGEVGQPDLELLSGLPEMLDPEIGIRGALRVTATEMVQA